jgi:hypothetical protein
MSTLSYYVFVWLYYDFVSYRMGKCSHEAHEHGEGCDHESYERGVEFTLFQNVDIQHVRCLNESVPDACQTVFKAWDDRFDLEKVVYVVYYPLECLFLAVSRVRLR